MPISKMIAALATLGAVPSEGLALIQEQLHSSRAQEMMFLPADAMIDDMIIPADQPVRTSPFRVEIEEDKKLRHALTPPACEKEVDKRERVFLMSIGQPYHGSTALEGVLLSSKNLASLCSYQKWQCEGTKIMEDNHLGDDAKMWNYTKMLDLYSEYYDLERPILLEKSPLQMMEVPFVYRGLEKVKNLPPSFSQAHIKTLNYAYLIMWRPVCLAHLSTHAVDVMKEKGVSFYAEQEMLVYQHFVEDIKFIESKNLPLLVLSLANLMWRPDREARRLTRFLPCMGDIDFDFVPKLGRDVYEGNQWKADGSVKSFGEAIDPTGFYDVRKSTCTKAKLFDKLSSKLQLESAEAEAFLSERS